MPSTGSTVLITIHTTVKDGKRKEVHKMEASGRLFQRGHILVLRFTEPREEGQERTTDQTIKLSDGQMLVQRKGAITMNQRFIPGTETEGTYHSLYGPLAMRTSTSEVTYEWDEIAGEGDIHLRYGLVMQGASTGSYHMHVEFKEV
ncbi:DUF1934 domain-containing protein [Salipaludibacillus agaradhaerens]|uniref:DUF1934 domain-containing protein n=1 Tax=Salipaludibacillus agaradhaerens TaxID=76935 RepID=UPI002151217C|nr:DUF1934 domain-containing protein [Salipaludibacillus agaradhaerens]MCR6108266.1 DUF1934 domain-containing protein [Salipaludibacillus agaradhaerens]MCR6120291.1 DUF1934 domain-containing protein [Salipaludibacillus agaradhaerens]UJW59305.1 DUF1934 domain-containing protein [Bacillus sp. A116_S68]